MHTYKPAAGRAAAAVCLTILMVAGLSLQLRAPAEAAQPVGDAQATVETEPVAHSGDAADDPAIWVDRADPARSAVIGNDKGGALEVYDLDGRRLQRITEGFFGNVDVLQGFRTGNGSVDLVVTYRAGVRVYRIDPGTRQLTNITDATGGSISGGGEGLCLYQSPEDGAVYAFSNTRDGQVTQFALTDADGDGLVEGARVRGWDVGSEVESCVADSESGVLYLSEEDVGIWKYGAEPEDPATPQARTLVDGLVGAGGHLLADVEGLALVDRPDGTGYLLASAQAPFGVDNFYAVYEREGANTFIRTFQVISGPEVDGCQHTDGIAAIATDLGPSFRSGLFVCQDDSNTAPGSSGNQNFKLVPLERVVSLDPAPPVNQPPRAVIGADCNDLTCTTTGADSSDPDGSITQYRWAFGDGGTATGVTATHTYAEPGTYTVTLTVTDNDGATGQASRTLSVPAQAGTISFVGAAMSAANFVEHRVTVPSAVRAGDALLLFFGSNTTAAITTPAGWEEIETVTVATSTTRAWWRIATSSDAGSAVGVQVASISKGNLALAAYRGTSATAPLASFAAVADTVGRLSHTTPRAAVSSPSSWAVSYWTHKDSVSSQLTPPADVSVRAAGSHSGYGRITALLADSGAPVPAGSYGGLTATATGLSVAASMWTVILAPAE
jgi:myo-inositol-hexaphosphate 3-phosphohydrolase